MSTKTRIYNIRCYIRRPYLLRDMLVARCRRAWWKVCPPPAFDLDDFRPVDDPDVVAEQKRKWSVLRRLGITS